MIGLLVGLVLDLLLGRRERMEYRREWVRSPAACFGDDAGRVRVS